MASAPEGARETKKHRKKHKKNKKLKWVLVKEEKEHEEKQPQEKESEQQQPEEEDRAIEVEPQETEAAAAEEEEEEEEQATELGREVCERDRLLRTRDCTPEKLQKDLAQYHNRDLVRLLVHELFEKEEVLLELLAHWCSQPMSGGTSGRGSSGESEDVRTFFAQLWTERPRIQLRGHSTPVLGLFPNVALSVPLLVTSRLLQACVAELVRRSIPPRQPGEQDEEEEDRERGEAPALRKGSLYDDPRALAAVGGVPPFTRVEMDETSVNMLYADFSYNQFVSAILPRWRVTRCYIRQTIGKSASRRVFIDGAVQSVLDGMQNLSQSMRNARTARDELVLRQLKVLISSPQFDVSQLDEVEERPRA